MIRKVEIRHFKCLRDVTVELSPLTVLVGANASGKSALLQALQLDIGVWDRTIWRRDKTKNLLVRLHEENQRVYELSYQPDPKPRVQRLNEGYSYQFLRLNLQALRQPNKVRYERRLAVDGGNLTNVVDSLTRDQVAGLLKQLCALVPIYRDVDARGSHVEGNKALFFQDRWDESVWYLPDEVSDGTILLLAFLILQYQESPPSLLLIEEPERGLHPYLLEQLVDLLRRLTTGELGGNPVQVVMATHSAELLDYLKPEEVRFMRRLDSGDVVVEQAPVDTPEWERSFSEYKESLASAWLSGGLGGVPGAA